MSRARPTPPAGWPGRKSLEAHPRRRGGPSARRRGSETPAPHSAGTTARAPRRPRCEIARAIRRQWCRSFLNLGVSLPTFLLPSPVVVVVLLVLVDLLLG